VLHPDLLLRLGNDRACHGGLFVHGAREALEE